MLHISCSHAFASEAVGHAFIANESADARSVATMTHEIRYGKTAFERAIPVGLATVGYASESSPRSKVGQFQLFNDSSSR